MYIVRVGFELVLYARTTRERRRKFRALWWWEGEVHRTPVEATRRRNDMRNLRWIVHVARQRGGGPMIVYGMARREGFVFRKEIVYPAEDGDAEDDVSSAHAWHC